MRNETRRNSIHLVFSSTTGEEKGLAKEQQEPDQIWGQLDLFASEKPDAVIIAQPDCLGFERLAQIIATGHARRILDLRKMPFISFDNETRESFLSVLEKNRVEYFNIFKLRHELCHSEVREDSELDDLCFDQIEAGKVLKTMIEKGPTVIFSDADPSIDKVVKKFLDSLSRASIPFSTVFATN